MKDIRFNISLYIIVPMIFAGIAVLSIIVSYNLTDYFRAINLNPQRPVLIFGLVMMTIAFILGLIISKMLLGPIEKFILKTEQLGVFDNAPLSVDQKVSKEDDIKRFNLIFDHVTEVLSKVESQKLFPKIAGQSDAMRGVFNQIIRVAGTDSTVLILGETGTGKELISKSIHEHSDRAGKPFVAINCAAIPSGLLESELFGHEKGAFTGADSRKLGKFELANNGTILMDEIGDMPLETQAKVLRVIQESQIERVGGIKPIKVNVRFIAATNKNLSEMVDAGMFRKDLFFRLNVFSISLPPLTKRKADIPVLIDDFLNQIGKKLTVSPDTLKILHDYQWPGNVRELRNIIESASVLADTTIEPFHLPATLAREGSSSKNGHQSINGSSDAAIQGSLDDHLKDVEKEIIIDALTRTNGVQVKAAQALGIKERSLWHRIKKLDIDVNSLKSDTG